MKRTILAFMMLGFLAVIVTSLTAHAEEGQSIPATATEAKKLFLEKKCNMCHSIESQKIETMAGGYTKSSEKNVPPDLSGIGSKRTAKWMADYLKKKEKINAVPHARYFRGSQEELQTLAEWLESLKK